MNHSKFVKNLKRKRKRQHCMNMTSKRWAKARKVDFHSPAKNDDVLLHPCPNQVLQTILKMLQHLLLPVIPTWITLHHHHHHHHHHCHHHHHHHHHLKVMSATRHQSLNNDQHPLYSEPSTSNHQTILPISHHWSVKDKPKMLSTRPCMTILLCYPLQSQLLLQRQRSLHHQHYQNNPLHHHKPANMMKTIPRQTIATTNKTRNHSFTTNQQSLYGMMMLFKMTKLQWTKSQLLWTKLLSERYRPI